MNKRQAKKFYKNDAPTIGAYVFNLNKDIYCEHFTGWKLSSELHKGGRVIIYDDWAFSATFPFTKVDDVIIAFNGDRFIFCYYGINPPATKKSWNNIIATRIHSREEFYNVIHELKERIDNEEVV